MNQRTGPASIRTKRIASKPGAVRRSVAGLVGASLILVAGSPVAAGEQEPLPPVPTVAGPNRGSGPHCSVSGATAVPRNVEIYDAPEGGSPIAKLTGIHIAFTLSDFPQSADAGRARIETGSSQGGFRIAGYVDASKLPLYAKRPLEVVPGHLWIGMGQAVKFEGAAPGKLHVEKNVTASTNQTFTTWAPCDALTLDDTPPPSWSVPGEARGYLTKKEETSLYDTAGAKGEAIATLKKASWSDGVLFWSTEARADSVRVEYHAEIVVQAWVKRRDVKALPKGETMDQMQPAQRRRNPPKLRIDGQPRLMKIDKRLQVRLSASSSGKAIGTIEPGTDIYVIQTVAGWANVLPRELNLAGPGDKSFWVKSSDLERPEK